MKKRKVRNVLNQKNQQLVFDSGDFDEISVKKQDTKIKQSNKPQIEIQSLQIQKDKIKVQPQQEKSCFQSFKHALWLYLIHIINYLQFDRIIEKKDLQQIKKQYVVKTKYPQNYELTYKQRQKSFGMSLVQIIKIKNQEQALKDKNFWSQLKKFICCQGGNQLQQADQLLTAASQSQFIYLSKIKKQHSKLPNQTHMTQESVMFNKSLQKVDNRQSKMTRQNPNVFQQFEHQSDLIFDDQISEQPNKNSFKNNKFDLQNMQTNHYQNVSSSQVNNSEESTLTGIKSKQKNTQKILVQNRLKESSNLQTISTNRNSLSNDKQFIQEISVDGHQQKNEYNKKNRRKQSRTTLPGENNQNSTNLDMHSDSNTIQEYSNLNLDHLNKNGQNLKNDDSDKISMTHSDSIDDFSDDLKLKKKNKKNRLKIKNNQDQSQQVNFDEDYINFENQQYLKSSKKSENNQNDQDDRRENQSASSHQLGKKAKKNTFNLQNDFNSGLQSIIKQGKQDEDNLQNKLNKNQSLVNSSMASNDLSSQSPQNAKKKKARNKKLFNLKQEQERMLQIMIFPDEDTNWQSKTINISESQNMQSLTSSTTNIKKKKRNKKLQDFNMENEQDNIIVIQVPDFMENKADNQVNKNISNHKHQVGQAGISLDNSSGVTSVKMDKKRKKKAKLKESMDKLEHQQFQFVDLGQMN